MSLTRTVPIILPIFGGKGSNLGGGLASSCKMTSCHGDRAKLTFPLGKQVLRAPIPAPKSPPPQLLSKANLPLPQQSRALASLSWCAGLEQPSSLPVWLPPRVILALVPL